MGCSPTFAVLANLLFPLVADLVAFGPAWVLHLALGLFSRRSAIEGGVHRVKRLMSEIIQVAVWEMTETTKVAWALANDGNTRGSAVAELLQLTGFIWITVSERLWGSI